MNIHKNARLTPCGRERIVKEVLSGQTPEAAVRAAGVCPRTVRKWVASSSSGGLLASGKWITVITGRASAPCARPACASSGVSSTPKNCRR